MRGTEYTRTSCCLYCCLSAHPGAAGAARPCSSCQHTLSVETTGTSVPAATGGGAAARQHDTAAVCGTGSTAAAGDGCAVAAGSCTAGVHLGHRCAGQSDKSRTHSLIRCGTDCQVIMHIRTSTPAAALKYCLAQQQYLRCVSRCGWLDKLVGHASCKLGKQAGSCSCCVCRCVHLAAGAAGVLHVCC